MHLQLCPQTFLAVVPFVNTSEYNVPKDYKKNVLLASYFVDTYIPEHTQLLVFLYY